MIKKIKNKKESSTYHIKLDLDSHGEVYEEHCVKVTGLEDAVFEANEVAVEFSGYTLDNWDDMGNDVYELQIGSGEQFILTITKGD